MAERCLDAAGGVPEISDSVVDVDRALRWGFGWELGPFEVMDAIGVKAFAAQVQKEGRALTPVLEKLLANGRTGFYEATKGTRTVFDIANGAAKRVEEPAGVLVLKSLKEAGRRGERNAGRGLIEFGAGPGGSGFRSQMNATWAGVVVV